MNCPNCNKKLVESNINHNKEDLFMNYWFCFKCYEMYGASSQSGDYTEEMLNYVGGIE